MGLRTAVHIEAGTARLLVEAIGPDFRLRSGLQLLGRTGNDPGASFPLTETAPGRYEASVPSVGGGLQEFEVYERLGDGWAVGGIWNPPGGELQALGPDQALLAYLCGATGGRVLSIATPEPPTPGWTWTPTPLRGVLILLALALFLLELGYRSTSLGQFKMARAALEVWWQAQAHLIDLARGISRSGRPGRLSMKASSRAMEAHRYLAERIREARDEERKRNNNDCQRRYGGRRDLTPGPFPKREGEPMSGISLSIGDCLGKNRRKPNPRPLPAWSFPGILLTGRANLRKPG